MKQTLILFLMLAAFGVGAESVDDKRILAVIINTSGSLADKVVPVLAQQQERIDKRCTLGSLTPEDVHVISVPTFGLDGIPTNGEWVVRYSTTACKAKILRTARFKSSTTNNGTRTDVLVEAGAPGETMADPLLERDVWTMFQKTIVRGKGGCNDMTLKNTTVTEAPRTSSANWKELWVAKACGGEVGQTIAFYPSPKGMLFRMVMPDEGQLRDKPTVPTYAPLSQ